MNPLDTLEHARRHAVRVSPLDTEKDYCVYLAINDTFSKAFWDVMRECEFFKHEDHSG